MRQALLEEFVDLTARRLAAVLADGTAHRAGRRIGSLSVV
jgi:hypothetical protein